MSAYDPKRPFPVNEINFIMQSANEDWIEVVKEV